MGLFRSNETNRFGEVVNRISYLNPITFSILVTPIILILQPPLAKPSSMSTNVRPPLELWSGSFLYIAYVRLFQVPSLICTIFYGAEQIQSSVTMIWLEGLYCVVLMIYYFSAYPGDSDLLKDCADSFPFLRSLAKQYYLYNQVEGQLRTQFNIRCPSGEMCDAFVNELSVYTYDPVSMLYQIHIRSNVLKCITWVRDQVRTYYFMYYVFKTVNGSVTGSSEWFIKSYLPWSFVINSIKTIQIYGMNWLLVNRYNGVASSDDQYELIGALPFYMKSMATQAGLTIGAFVYLTAPPKVKDLIIASTLVPVTVVMFNSSVLSYVPTNPSHNGVLKAVNIRPVVEEVEGSVLNHPKIGVKRGMDISSLLKTQLTELNLYDGTFMSVWADYRTWWLVYRDCGIEIRKFVNGIYDPISAYRTLVKIWSNIDCTLIIFTVVLYVPVLVMGLFMSDPTPERPRPRTWNDRLKPLNPVSSESKSLTRMICRFIIEVLKLIVFSILIIASSTVTYKISGIIMNLIMDLISSNTLLYIVAFMISVTVTSILRILLLYLFYGVPIV